MGTSARQGQADKMDFDCCGYANRPTRLVRNSLIPTRVARTKTRQNESEILPKCPMSAYSRFAAGDGEHDGTHAEKATPRISYEEMTT